ncbi:hypothetical protein DFH08DRAFT_887230 [Mycena albidolilacea]|uniref:Extracellular serine-rich protein n=1 Tax=Mycena albidolilacea TaxID=1033008 RepID=A0AAD6ZIQ8_9AGAR|nr:hypothetical protein DFH08DRAFT_887230 [Mycena albidolilacea]
MGGSSPARVFVDVSDDNGSYQFNPNIIHATNGTVVTFRFSGIPGNHSVTQSTFASPCQPLAGGFDSGFVTARDPFPGFNYTVVNDQKAAWFYCRQNTPTVHCHSGMVGVINGVISRFKDFQDAAEAITDTNSTASPSNPTASTLQHTKAPIPVGAIVAGTIGALTFIALCICTFVLLRRRRRRQRAQLEGTRPDPLIVHEKGPFPSTDDSVPKLSRILREVRSLRRQTRHVSGPPSPNEPPPKYTVSASVSSSID